MGSSSSTLTGEDATLFDPVELPLSTQKRPRFKAIDRPLWTERKAQLIADYLRLFVFITKHGTYIDGFAGPQEREHPEMWSAKLVLENEPRWLRSFFLCDINRRSAQAVEDLRAAQPTDPKRHVAVHHGDFNTWVDEVLASGHVAEKVATFCLLDQRAMECDWNTVRKLAEVKSGNKIELFYFLASGWIHRSWAGLKSDKRADQWWGNSSWQELRSLNVIECAQLVSERFKKELGYTYAVPWEIRSKGHGSRIMYHMIHATDHDEAPKLMARAYRSTTGQHPLPVQLQLFDGSAED